MAAGQFELHQLRCFVAVARDLNFSRAAERLNMTQPPLSRQIKLLEHRLGLILLARSNRSVRLTPAGESLLASATDLLQRAEHAVLKAQQAARGEAGSIQMGFVPSAALEFLPRVVASLARQMANLTYRDIDIPARFRSELFLCSAAGRRTPLHAAVRAVIVGALAGAG